MFRKVHVPLLGLVENMSYYSCPNCGHQDHIFGSGGGATACGDLGIQLLGQVSMLCGRGGWHLPLLYRVDSGTACLAIVQPGWCFVAGCTLP